MSDKLEWMIEVVAGALEANPACGSGLLVRHCVTAVEQGPSGGPELLALVHADDAFFGYCYGHVQLHPARPGCFVAGLVWAGMLVNAPDSKLLLRRYHYWMRNRLAYRECVIQDKGDAYRETTTVEDAVHALAGMIRRFRFETRWPDGEGPWAESPVETRMLDIYGFGEEQMARGHEMPLPMPVRLSVVRGSKAG